LLEQIPVLLARTPDEEVPAALQPQPRFSVERDASVRAVELLRDHAEPAAQRVERDLIEVGVAGLEPRTLEVSRPRVLVDLAHRMATATMWFSMWSIVGRSQSVDHRCAAMLMKGRLGRCDERMLLLYVHICSRAISSPRLHTA
jgi:hypothetical protein